MKRPFDYINGNKIDVNNPEHQEVILHRNRKLESAKKIGLIIGDTKVKVTVTVELECPRCGTTLENESDYLDPYEVQEEVIDVLPQKLKCGCCKSKFNIYKFSYHIKTPKPISDGK